MPRPAPIRVEGTTGYIPGHVTVWKAQRDAVVDYVREALPEYTPGQLKLVAHVAWCQFRNPQTYEEGVPLYHRLIERLDEDTHRHSGLEVHGPLHEAGLLQMTRYVVPKGHTQGLSRDYLVHPDLIDRLTMLVPHDSENLPPRVDLFTGTRVRSSGERHVLKKDGNAVGSELYRQAIPTLKFGYYYEPAVTAHLEALSNRMEELKAAWERTGGHEYVPALREQLEAARALVETPDEDGVIGVWSVGLIRAAADAYRKAHGEPHTAEYLAYRTAHGQWRNDKSCFDAVLRQFPEATARPGMKRYRLAYSHQSSGRAGAVGGMFQSASRAMKEAAYSFLDDVHNWDLVGSQPNFLIELFDEANRHPAAPQPALDAGWMVRYVSDRDAKHAYAARVGISANTWKTCICAVLMGAWLAKDIETSEGDLAKAFRADPACSTPESLLACWGRFREALGPFYGELERWRVWLDEVYAADPHHSGPHRSGGRWVRNAAGETYHWTTHDRASNKRVPPHERRAQLAAHLLQGKEAAFILYLILLAPSYGYVVIAHEHDGVVTIGEVPAEAMERARELSGVRRADLRVKGYV